MRKYFDYIKIGIREHVVYAGAVRATFFSKIIYLYMQFALWNALYSSNPGVKTALSHDETIRYIIVATILYTFMECNVIDWINTDIRTGNIANLLIRPVDFRVMILSKHIGTSLIKTLLYCVPLTALTLIFFRKPILCREQIPFGMISVIAAFFIQFLYSLIIGLAAFWLIVTWPVNMLLAAVYKLLSGAWIPVAMFPEILDKINMFLPFRAIYAIPVTIMTTAMDIREICSDIAVQFIWISILLVISLIVWKTGRRKLVVQGG